MENVYKNKGDFMSERGYNDGFLMVRASAGGRREMEGSGFASKIISETWRRAEKNRAYGEMRRGEMEIPPGSE